MVAALFGFPVLSYHPIKQVHSVCVYGTVRGKANIREQKWEKEVVVDKRVKKQCSKVSCMSLLHQRFHFR